jgi:hypothetical protein
LAIQLSISYFPLVKNSIMAPSNLAAILSAKSTPLKVQPSAYTPPGQNEIVVKNAAVAVNPYDWIIQDAPGLVVSWVKLPFVLGTDVAGEVVEVGKDVKRFKGIPDFEAISPHPNVAGIVANSKLCTKQC